VFINDVAAPEQPPAIPPTLDEIDVIRHREITSKAVSAILLLVLKWFKVSRMCIDRYTFVKFANDHKYARCDEVPPSWPAFARYQLFTPNS